MDPSGQKGGGGGGDNYSPELKSENLQSRMTGFFQSRCKCVLREKVGDGKGSEGMAKKRDSAASREMGKGIEKKLIWGMQDVEEERRPDILMK